MNKRFEVWIDDSVKNIDEFKDDLRRYTEKFMVPYVRKVKILQNSSIKPGGAIYPSKTTKGYGTLGAFAYASDQSTGVPKKFIAGLTCQHVLETSECYIKSSSSNERTKLGSEIKPHADSNSTDGLAAVQIDKANLKVNPSLNIEWKKRNLKTTLHNGQGNLNGRMVYKKGATTDETEGTIIASEYGGTNGIVIKGTTENPFSEPGDSGSVVFRFPDNSAEDDTAEVISMVQGHALEEEVPFATMSFRLNDAIDAFERNKCVNLKLIWFPGFVALVLRKNASIIWSYGKQAHTFKNY